MICPLSFSQKNLVLKSNPKHKETLLSTVLGFTKDRRFTDDYSILAMEVTGFSQDLRPQ